MQVVHSLNKLGGSEPVGDGVMKTGYVLMFGAALIALLGATVPAMAQTHFVPVQETGEPYPIAIASATWNGAALVAGDEIAVYDGTLCVGAAVVPAGGTMSLVAWEGFPSLGLEGFVPGNPILFKIWKSASLQELAGVADYTAGDGRFGTGFGTVAQASVLTGPGQFNLWPISASVGAQGGNILYGAQLIYRQAAPVPGLTFWTMVTLPNGSTIGPVSQTAFGLPGPVNMSLPSFSQAIAAAAPSGQYTLTGYVGAYPNVLRSDSFTFVKTP